MTGRELAKKVIELRPHIPVILCTGYSETISREADLTGIKKLLMKPFDIAQLTEIIQKFSTGINSNILIRIILLYPQNRRVQLINPPQQSERWKKI